MWVYSVKCIYGQTVFYIFNENPIFKTTTSTCSMMLDLDHQDGLIFILNHKGIILRTNSFMNIGSIIVTLSK